MWVSYVAEKVTKNRLSLIVSCWIPTVCGVRLSYVLQAESDCFISNPETSGKLVEGLSVVLLYSRLQGITTEEMWQVTAGFITKWHISRPELL